MIKKIFLYVVSVIIISNTVFSASHDNLVQAAERGDFTGVRNALVEGADINYRDLRHGNTALIWAIYKMDINAVKFLVEKGANVNLANNMTATPLSYAASEGKIEIVRFLLLKGAVLPAETAHFLINKAIERKQNEMVILLTQAVKNLKNVKVENVLLIDGLLLNTLFHRNITLAKFMLLQGARVNAMTNNTSVSLYTTPYTPLMMAAEKGLEEMVKLLIQKGAEVNAVNRMDNNYTPLIYAVSRGHVKIVEILIQHRANVNWSDRYGWTPLNISKRYSSRAGSGNNWNEIIRILRKAGARETRMPLVREM